MAASYLLSAAVTEICAKQKDYNEQRYGVNDSKGYDRAQILFWEAVNTLICPTDQLKTDYPEFYNFTVNLPGHHIHGLIITVDEAIEDGEIDLMDLTDFMKLVKYINAPNISPDRTGPTITGNKLYLRKISMEKISNMGTKIIVPDNILYVAEEDTLLKFYPLTADDNIRITYIKTPDNNMDTDQSLLEYFSMSFIVKAVALASQLLEYERTRK